MKDIIEYLFEIALAVCLSGVIILAFLLVAGFVHGAFNYYF